jgi:hypothetical protein
MASNPSFTKRQKERQRKEKQQEKAAKKAERRRERALRPEGAPGDEIAIAPAEAAVAIEP